MHLHHKLAEVLPKYLIKQEANTLIDKETLLVSYFDTEKNKKIQIKLGRLLTKQTSLTELEIKNLVEFQRRNLKGEVLMALTQDADEIVDYYAIHVAPNGGTSSCMHNEDCVKVYSYDSNLFLATFYDGADTSLDNYVGRCLVRKDTMEFIRIYSTEQKYQDNILLTLETAEYYKGGLRGIELAKEETKGGYVMPYLDCNGMYLEDQGHYFEVVSYNTSLKADSTNGVLKYGCTCGLCGEVMDEDNVRYTNQDGDVCESCFDDNYVTFGDACETYRISDCTTVIGGDYDDCYVPDCLLSDYSYYKPVDSSYYYYIDELFYYNDSFYRTENCVELAEETDEGDSYAPERECTELTVSDIHELEDWYNCEWKLGWYTDERYADIMEEVKRLLEVQEAGQTDLVDLIEELA